MTDVGGRTDPIEGAAETMLWYLKTKGPLPQITAYRIIRDTYGPRCVAQSSRSLDPDVLKAFKALHGGEVRRVGQVWYLKKDFEDWHRPGKPCPSGRSLINGAGSSTEADRPAT